MNKKNAQVVNTAFIVVGGAMLIYTIASEEPHQYLQIAGFVIIMFGLYRATNHWVETKDDHKEEQE
jgi:hypothetical protein